MKLSMEEFDYEALADLHTPWRAVRPPRVLRRPPINIAMNIRPEVFGPLASDQQ
jgi:hypothetical protein